VSDKDHTYHALWIGGRLPDFAAGCLASFRRHGHPVVLHTYEGVTNVPEGVAVSDAAKVLPAKHIFRHHRTRGFSAFADHFRFRQLEVLGGTWVDCDVYLLRPIADSSPVLYGLSEPTTISTAVLRLPSGSPLLHDLLGIFEHQPHKLPWMLPSTRRRAWLRHHLLRKPYFAVTPIGSTGPNALSYLARQHGLADQARPLRTFCPLPWEEAARMTESAFDIRAFLDESSLGVHLWNDVLRHRREPPEPGSFLARIEAEGRGGPPALSLA